MKKWMLVLLPLLGALPVGCSQSRPTANVATVSSIQSLAVAPVPDPDARVETIICIRHAEKPPGGLGQLTVKGLNRSLALPKVLMGRYGTPLYIFAPNPSELVDKKEGVYFYYVRPLATIEPTAILCGLPVNTEFGFREIDRLENELLQPQYENSVLFVAWEHGQLASFARNMIRDHKGDVRQVANWPGEDYDTIYIFRITTRDGKKTFSFTIEKEGLNDVSDKYPEPAGH